MGESSSNYPLSILIMISGLDIGGAHGGAERFGLELSRQLDKDKFDVTLCAFWKHSSKAESFWLQRLTEDNVNVIFGAEWRDRFDLREYFQVVQRLSRRFQSNPLDIIHSHFQMGTFAALLLKFLGRTKVTMRTAHVSVEWGRGFASWVCRQIFTNWFYPLFLDQEVGVSQAVVDKLNHHPGKLLTGKQPALIHNAIYPEIFKPNLQPPNHHPLLEETRGKLVIGSIGRLTKQKGYEYLLAAVPSVIAVIPEVFFLIIGDGELKQELQAKAVRLGISEHVLLTGQREDAIAILRQMQIFVLPSIYEGLPTVILESMACGIPVIATDIPGTDELIIDGENGWLVPPKDSTVLAQTIISALQEPVLRSKYAERGRQKVLGFLIEEVTRQYEHLYTQLSEPQVTTPD